MRTLIAISTLLGTLVTVSSFAASTNTPVTPPANNTTPSNVAANQATPAATAASVSTESSAPKANSIHANLNLKQEGQRLYAHVTIEQAENNSGKVRIDWTPPSHSSCDRSSYFLPYQGTKFHTQAYRTLGYGLISGKSITCTGVWRAAVINEQGTTLTTATITIESVDSYANNNNAEKMHSLAAIA